MAATLEDARAFAEDVGYPVLIRPSYVLSGGAMNVVSDATQLQEYLSAATLLSPEHPVVISKFYTNSKEFEIDAVAKDGRIVIFAISEHIENAGVHSGDATVVLPPQRLYLESVRRAKRIAKAIAKELAITGPFNIQFLAKENAIKVICLMLKCLCENTASTTRKPLTLFVLCADRGTIMTQSSAIESPHGKAPFLHIDSTF